MSTERLQVVFLDSDTLPSSIHYKPMGFDYDLISYPRSTADQAVERCREADIVIANKVPISKGVDRTSA